MVKVAVLGDGITGTAVRRALSHLKGYEAVADLDRADIVVASPGIPPRDYPAGKAVISEIEFAYQLIHTGAAGPIPKLIGITGTNGKTTVTALIAHLLQVPAYGNIGTPLIDYVTQEHFHPFLVVELSSYQLESCDTFRPDVAVFLNLTPDHFARHRDMVGYGSSKSKIFARQTPSDTLVYNADDPALAPWIAGAVAQKRPFGKDDPLFGQVSCYLHLKGTHNVYNGMAAALAVAAVGLDQQTIWTRMETFPGVAHRIEYVATVRGVEVYNDSKGTNPDSTICAVEAFPDRRIHLILCGQDKGLPLEEFARFLAERVVSVTVFGEMTSRFTPIFEAQNSSVPLRTARTMSDAWQRVLSHLRAGDVILFSPSGASFDQFKNFEDRGDQFKAMVKGAL